MKMHFASMCFVAFVVLGLPAAYAQVPPNPGNQFQSHNFQYNSSVLTSGSTGTVVNAWNALNPPKWYTLSISGTATPVSVVLEGSLDGVNYSTIAVTNSYVGTISNALPLPFLYFRTRGASVPATKSVTAVSIGVW